MRKLLYLSFVFSLFANAQAVINVPVPRELKRCKTRFDCTPVATRCDGCCKGQAIARHGMAQHRQMGFDVCGKDVIVDSDDCQCTDSENRDFDHIPGCQDGYCIACVEGQCVERLDPKMKLEEMGLGEPLKPSPLESYHPDKIPAHLLFKK
jgi:hypothetical protein